jgi:hypothetical protein
MRPCKSVLEPIDDGIWLAEGGNVSFYGFPYPTRSVIVRLEDRRLWIWSPIALTPQLRSEVDELGAVAHLVSPNKLHHLYLQDWEAAFPEARLWGPQSTTKKRPDLAFQPALGDESPPEWAGAIDQAWFCGSPLLDEIEFFHKPSATAMIADMSQNFSERFLHNHWSWWQRPLARLAGMTEGTGYGPLELRLTTLDRSQARAALEKMLAWQARRVVMAHGVWQRDNGRAYLERAFHWLQS